MIDNFIPSYVITDRVKLHRILLNLLGNAIKFTKFGYVSIEVKLLQQNKENVELEFRVADTGIGISAESQEKIYDRFFRADPSYNGNYRGHGIGLHIVQKYVELLGGNIKLKSELNQGTSFYFTLMLKIGEGETIAQTTNLSSDQDFVTKVEPAFAAPSLKELKPKNNLPLILLVEDNMIALKTLERLVELANCQYMSAMDGEQAFKLATSQSFDLIITDIGLPDFSGIELTKRIRKWEISQYIKPISIIGLTGHALQQAEPECLLAGMNKVLCKPANIETIQSLIQDFISTK